MSCSSDVMNHVDCVIKRDVYPQNMYLCLKISVVYHFCSKNIRGTSKYIS